MDHNFFASLREEKRIHRSGRGRQQRRQAEKSPPRPRARTSAARYEKPTSAGRPTLVRQTRANKREISERPFYSFAALRLCENKKEKIIGAQRRQAAKSLSSADSHCEKKKKGARRSEGLRKSYRAHHNFFAALRLCEKKIRRSLPTVGRRTSKATKSAAADSQEFQKQ